MNNIHDHAAIIRTLQYIGEAITDIGWSAIVAQLPKDFVSGKSLTKAAHDFLWGYDHQFAPCDRGALRWAVTPCCKKTIIELSDEEQCCGLYMR
jgi:hypothetical protein